MKQRSLSLPLALVLALLVVATASSYVLVSPPRTWNCPPVFIVDNRGIADIADGDGGSSRAVSAIASADAWNGAGAGTILKAVKGSVAGFNLGDGIPMINFRDPLGICSGSCLAVTFSGFYTERHPGSGSYRITDSDIIVNAASRSWTSQGEDPGGVGCSGEIYIEGFLVHEVGHALGLGHTNVAGATMFPGVTLCNNSAATTEADDEAGIRALYGTSPCGTCDNHTEYLSGPADFDIQPCASHLCSTLSGTLGGWLEGPAGTNFDLYLELWDGSSWVVVASSTGPGSSESVSYQGTAGSYRYRVVSVSGAGTYHFWHVRP